MASKKVSDGVMAELVAIPGRLVSAWAAHDAVAFSQLFIQDGTMILPGVYKRGREEIRKYMAAEYAGQYKGTTVTGSPLEAKPLGSEAVAMITDGGVLAPGEKVVSSKEAIRASWIMVKDDDGMWRISVYHNCPRDLAS
jgi:uncharacterized protein (TIGR02246 family)